jgi:hypothetical protein
MLLPAPGVARSAHPPAPILAFRACHGCWSPFSSRLVDTPSLPGHGSAQV